MVAMENMVLGAWTLEDLLGIIENKTESGEGRRGDARAETAVSRLGALEN